VLELAAELGISADDVNDIIKEPAFGAAWSVIEDRSPLFGRQLLRPAELPEQIAIARRSLASLREATQARDNTSRRNCAYRSARSTTQVDPICSMKRAAASSPVRG
jgi:hypothetical protein